MKPRAGIVGNEGQKVEHMGPWRRSAVGSIATLVVMAPLVAVMIPLRDHLSIATTGLVLVVPVVIGVVVGGFRAGVFGVLAGFLVYDLVFIPPYFTLTVGANENWVVLVVYVAVMLLVASVVARLETARTEAHQHEEAIRRLFELTDLLIEDRPLSEILELIVSTVHEAFALRSVALLLPVDAKLDVVASAGEPLSEAELRRVAPEPGVPASLGSSAPARHEQAQTVALTATGRPIGLLHIWGAGLSRHDQDLLHTFANHMALALERAQLREQALRTELLEEVDRLQRALVSAVSHDLRTPLATIKASASTLRSAHAEVTPGGPRGAARAHRQPDRPPRPPRHQPARPVACAGRRPRAAQPADRRARPRHRRHPWPGVPEPTSPTSRRRWTTTSRWSTSITS